MWLPIAVYFGRGHRRAGLFGQPRTFDVLSRTPSNASTLNAARMPLLAPPLHPVELNEAGRALWIVESWRARLPANPRSMSVPCPGADARYVTRSATLTDDLRS